MTEYCPQCTYSGTEAEVDEHRATGVHNDEPQAGGNLRSRPGEPGPEKWVRDAIAEQEAYLERRRTES